MELEQYQSLLLLAKQALMFYANSWNYQDKISNPSPIAFDDYGSQARFVLQQMQQLELMQANMINDFNNIKFEEPLTNIEDITQIIKDNL